MKWKYLLLTSSILASTVRSLDIPAVESIVQEIKSKFRPYIDYEGPTGTAKSALSTATRAVPFIAATPTDPPYWLADISHQGYAPYTPNPSTYKVFRNVKDYGAKGTGRHLGEIEGQLE